jgi:multidrug resistance efflux pump
VYADEGEKVTAGQRLVALRNLDLESRAARARADLEVAAARATEAHLRFADFGQNEQERRQFAQQEASVAQEASKLSLISPISGLVLTPRVRDRMGSYVTAGTEIAEVADTSEMRARLYVPEFDMRDVHPNAAVSLHFDARFGPRLARLGTTSPASTEIPDGLIHKQDYKGLEAPRYYVAEVLLSNRDGALHDGMAGSAKIFVRRRSLMGFVWQDVHDFLGRKIW